MTSAGGVGVSYDGRQNIASAPGGTYGYDGLNQLTSKVGTRKWGHAPLSTARSHDGAGRLASLTHNLAGTTRDLPLGFTYNPAGQITNRTMSNTAYAYAPGASATGYVNNGRNQVTSAGGVGVSYDGRQNIASAPGGTYGYDGLNQLTSATVAGTTTGLSYDPVGRLHQLGSTRFLYDGPQAIGEYDTSGALDDVVTAYEGPGYDRRWLLQDERGAVVSITDGSGDAHHFLNRQPSARPEWIILEQARGSGHAPPMPKGVGRCDGAVNLAGRSTSLFGTPFAKRTGPRFLHAGREPVAQAR